MNDQETRLRRVLEERTIVARYFKMVHGSYRVEVGAICPTEGTDWGGYNVVLSARGETLEEAKGNLIDLCNRECVPGFKIHEWKEQAYCPLYAYHHIGTVCGSCGQEG